MPLSKLAKLFISAALGIFFGLAGYKLSEQSGESIPKIDAIFGWIFGMLSTVIVNQVLHDSQIDRLDEEVRLATDLGRRAMLATSVNSSLTRQMRALSKLPSMVQSTALVALQQAIDAFDFVSRGGSAYIRGRRLAIFSYAKFWEAVGVAQQQQATTVVARMTHSVDIEILFNGEGLEIETYHRLFVNQKGKLFRIFIDREPPDSRRITRYISAIEYMQGVGVNCCYLNICQD